MISIFRKTILLTRTQASIVLSQTCYLSHLTAKKLPLINTKCLQVQILPKNSLFWEPDRKGGYNKNFKRVSRKQLILEGLKDLKQEIVLWKEEVKEKLESDPILVFRPGASYFVFKLPAICL